jgi:hypothetical protein
VDRCGWLHEQYCRVEPRITPTITIRNGEDGHLRIAQPTGNLALPVPLPIMFLCVAA